MDKEKLIHILFLLDSSHDAEVLGSSLRNQGYAVRPQHVEDAEDLNQALDQKSWDILLCAPQVGDYTAIKALEDVSKQAKDIPTIVFGEATDTDTSVNLMRAGAAAIIETREQEKLLLTIERELAHLQDRREHRACRRKLAESEKRNRVLIDSSRDAIAYIHEGMHIYANLSYLEMFGYEDLEEIESLPIMDMISTDHQQNFKDVLRQLSKGETPEKEFEFDAQKVSGEQFNAIMEFSPASIDGEDCTQVVIRRPADNQELAKELEQLKKQDLLTGLFNRQYFMEELTNAINWATKDQSQSTMIYLEPDQFKTIKDTLGIAGSDIVLTDIAGILKQYLPDDAILSRFAGTIFTALLPNKGTDDVEQMAEQIREHFEQHVFEVDDNTVSTTCSIGVTPISETTPNAKHAINQADSACTLAKKEGNSIHIHTVADQLASLEKERQWNERIKLALKTNKFTLHFQPIVTLHPEPGEPYEVLIRMLDSEGKIIMPGDFIPAAHTARLMGEIDRWVMKNSAKAILEQRRDGKEVYFFIKLSTESLEDAMLLPWVSKLLKAARLHGASFVFEVSESAILNNPKAAKALSLGLKKLHSSMAVDHVGSENSSLSYLNQLDVSFLKIDGSHIQNLSNSEMAQNAVKQIAEVAGKINAQTIAEHIQDPTCLAILWQHGVNFIQGNYLQQPKNGLNYDFSAEH